jgi:predicted RNase H-like HicB family nuclease
MNKLERRGKQMRYAVVIEQAEAGYSAYVPDLPGCFATGSSVDEVEGLIHDAIEFHLEGMQADGMMIPRPVSKVEYMEVAA